MVGYSEIAGTPMLVKHISNWSVPLWMEINRICLNTCRYVNMCLGNWDAPRKSFWCDGEWSVWLGDHDDVNTNKVYVHYTSAGFQIIISIILIVPKFFPFFLGFRKMSLIVYQFCTLLLHFCWRFTVKPGKISGMFIIVCTKKANQAWEN